MAETRERRKRNGPPALRRLLQVLDVLARHNVLGALFGRSHSPTPSQVREAVKELGLVFVKFGQVLAMHHELLPRAYIDELELLHDDLPPMVFDVVRATVEQSLGRPLPALFACFGQTPLAAATVAQVHDAMTLDGRRVAVKVQRPGLVPIIAADIAALTTLVALGEKLLPRLRAFELPRVVSEYHRSLKQAIDFHREARAVMIFRSALADAHGPWIPEVVAALSSGVVLTMEFSASERIDEAARQHHEALPRSMNTLARVMLQ